MLKVTVEDFARSFGTTSDDIPEECLKLISTIDFGYEIVTGQERDNVILNVLKKIDADTQIIAAPDRQDAWEKGWEENFKSFIEKGYDLRTLIPKFIRPNQLIRFSGNYIKPKNPLFELDYFKVFRLWIFRKYLKDVDSIYEFGCGTGFNLVELANMYPGKNLYGSDFVPSSRDLINKIAQVYKFNLKGFLFDMLKPDEKITIDKNSAVYTFGSIEQLGSKFEAFLQYLLKQSPKLCINLEPTVELYDQDNLFDYLAVKFHVKRGYTRNYLPRLNELESQGKIEILKVKRLHFGSMFMEGFTYIIWRPVQA